MSLVFCNTSQLLTAPHHSNLTTFPYGTAASQFFSQDSNLTQPFAYRTAAVLPFLITQHPHSSTQHFNTAAAQPFYTAFTTVPQLHSHSTQHSNLTPSHTAAPAHTTPSFIFSSLWIWGSLRPYILDFIFIIMRRHKNFNTLACITKTFYTLLPCTAAYWFSPKHISYANLRGKLYD